MSVHRTPCGGKANKRQTIGTEIVKIILLTIPYVIAAAPGVESADKAAQLMEKTDIIASEPHALQALVNPYTSSGTKEDPVENLSSLKLLQSQLQAEAGDNWPLACLPRPWNMPFADVELREQLEKATKHTLPSISIPESVIAGPRPLFPEVYFSVYQDLEVESVPPTTNIASSLIRDGLLDSINILDFNRHISAKFLIDIDCYFADDTFVKRATPFDRLREMQSGVTWKPEDMAGRRRLFANVPAAHPGTQGRLLSLGSDRGMQAGASCNSTELRQSNQVLVPQHGQYGPGAWLPFYRLVLSPLEQLWVHVEVVRVVGMMLP